MRGDALKRKLDAKVVASRPTRSYRAAAFQAYVLLASAVFVGLAVAAHFVPYFAIDLTVTRAVQSWHGPLLDGAMRGVSWLGFAPQVYFIAGAIMVLLFLLGLEWEAVAAVVAGLGVALGSLVKLIVYRPRPTADLVRVFNELSTMSFPSGHVLLATAFGGFLAFLVYTLLRPSWARTLLLVLFGALVLSMGASRIYLGHHWFSDVLGAYVLGSLWLALSIKVYRWGKPRFFAGQPVAPEAEVGGARSRTDARPGPSFDR